MCLWDARQQATMGWEAGDLCFGLGVPGWAGLSWAELCCKRRQKKAGRIEKDGAGALSCEGGVQKVMLVPLREIRSNTVGPVVASLLRHEEKGRERGKKRKVLHGKIWQRFAGRSGGREEEG